MKQSVEIDAKIADSDASAWLSDRAAVRWLAVLVVYAAVRGVVAAAARPFWCDEVCTWIMVHQPGMRGIWSALEHAVDGQGPAYYVIARAASGMLANQEIALRLPSIFGFCCLAVCVFIFVRRRIGNALALICSFVLFTTVLFDVYAVEARAYSLVVACVAVALVCYQRASSWRWSLLLGFCLALAVSLHYYAVFAFVPFGAAEGVRLLRTREIRFGVWLALLCGFVPLAIFWPLLSHLRQYYGAHFYAKPTLFTVAVTYGAFFEVAGRWGVGVAAALTLGVLGAALAAVNGRAKATCTCESPFDGQVLTLALLALPVGIYVATKVAHGGLTVRYALPAVIGVPLALSYILSRLGHRSVAFVVAFLLFAVAAREGQFWLSHRGPLASGESNTDSIESLIETAGHEDLPVMVSDDLEFLALVHYAEPHWQERFVCVVDAEQAVAYTGADVADKELVVLRTVANIHVYKFQGFAAQNPSFLLFSDDGRESGGGTEVSDWWPIRLVRDGYSLDLLAADGTRRVYLVSAGKNSR